MQEDIRRDGAGPPAGVVGARFGECPRPSPLSARPRRLCYLRIAVTADTRRLTRGERATIFAVRRAGRLPKRPKGADCKSVGLRPTEVRILHLPPPPDDLRRRGEFHEFFLALRRGLVLGRCRTCETFYLMAKLCVEEGGELLAPGERAEATGWAEGGTLVEIDFGCEGACAVIPLYGRIAR